ncbi:hypothetical protein D3C76_1424080 [compost metagenome]
MFPAVSVAVKRMLRVPSSSAVSGVKVQLPEALTTAVPISSSSTMMWMVAPTSPLPVRVGCASLVVSPLFRVVVAVPTSSTAVSRIGACGAVVSIFSENAGEVPETLPAASVALTRRSCGP